jgi:hypothetical protein
MQAMGKQQPIIHGGENSPTKIRKERQGHSGISVNILLTTALKMKAENVKDIHTCTNSR